MSARLEGPFAACLQFAAEQARAWVPRWLSQLNAALRMQEDASTSFIEKQAHGLSRAVLLNHRDAVETRFLAELDELIQNTDRGVGLDVMHRKSSALRLDDLQLVDHGQVQEKVDLERMKQTVRMRVELSLAELDARVCRARGLDVVRSNANPLQPDAIVSALARALDALHLEHAVRALWMQAGAVPLGAELERFYRAMADMLGQRGVEPAGYLVVQKGASRPASPVAPLADREHEFADSTPMESLDGEGPQLTLDHLHELLTNHLADAIRKGRSPSVASGVAYPLAAEVVTVMLRHIAEDGRLPLPLRDLLQGLQPVLMQLAQSDPGFFADRANHARRLLDAITSSGAAFRSERDPGFAEFLERTGRVVGALKLADGDLPMRLVASVQRFLPPVSRPVTRELQAAVGASRTNDDLIDRPDFVDTEPMAHSPAFREKDPRGTSFDALHAGR